MKKAIIAVLSVTFLLGSVAAVLAEEPTGNKRKGKYIYRKVYKACHERGEVETPKPVMNPDAKTQAEWETVFESKAFDAFKCQAEWEGLSDEDLMDIYSYLHAHAADSPTPAKCQ